MISPNDPEGGAIRELAERPQWVLYASAVDKAPRRWSAPAHKLLLASHSEPSDWTSYDDAIAAAAAAGAAGVGFVFTDHDPYSGVDLDGCRDPETGVIAPWAERIIARLHSYTEISPSQTGVKIFVRGTLPAAIKASFGAHVGIEIYSTRRYFTVTGQHLAGTPETINDAQAALDELACELRPAPPHTDTAPVRVRASPSAADGERVSARDVIDRLNRENDLGDYLVSKGATLVRQQGSDRLYSGLNGDIHTHVTTYKVTPSANGIGHIGFSYSPNGALNNVDHPRGFRWFDAFAALEHNGSALATLRAVNPIEKKASCDRPQTAAQAKDAARKRDARKQAAAELRAEVETRIAADDTLSRADRAVLETLLTIAAERGWCRPSKERIAEMCGYSLGSVKRSLMSLEGRYIVSTGDGGAANLTAVRTFLRGSFAASDAPAPPADSGRSYVDHFATPVDDEGGQPYVDQNDPRVIYISTDQEKPVGVCEWGAGSEPRGDADSLDTWAWQDAACGADDVAKMFAESANISIDSTSATVADLNVSQIGKHFRHEAAQNPKFLDFEGRIARPACGRWQAYDGQRWTWHATEDAAKRAAGLEVAPDGPGASYDPALDLTATSTQPYAYSRGISPKDAYILRGDAYADVIASMRVVEQATLPIEADERGTCSTRTPESADPYEQKLAAMSDRELGGEKVKWRRVRVRRGDDPAWLKARASAVDREIFRRVRQAMGTNAAPAVGVADHPPRLTSSPAQASLFVGGV